MDNKQQEAVKGGLRASNPRQRLIIDLDAAKGRLERSQDRLRQLEETQPGAFFEIRRAKDIVLAAKGIVNLYARQLEEMDKGK